MWKSFPRADLKFIQFLLQPNYFITRLSSSFLLLFYVLQQWKAEDDEWKMAPARFVISFQFTYLGGFHFIPLFFSLSALEYLSAWRGISVEMVLYLGHGWKEIETRRSTERINVMRRYCRCNCFWCEICVTSATTITTAIPLFSFVRYTNLLLLIQGWRLSGDEIK